MKGNIEELGMITLLKEHKMGYIPQLAEHMVEQEKVEETAKMKKVNKKDKSEFDDNSITCNTKKSVIDLSEDVNKLYKVNLVDKAVKDKITK